jgi:hypothetical protein
VAGGAGRKVGAMNGQDHERRAVPRHIRDAEHDSWDEAPAGPETAGRRVRLLVYLVTILIAGTGLWYFLTTRP